MFRGKLFLPDLISRAVPIFHLERWKLSSSLTYHSDNFWGRSHGTSAIIFIIIFDGTKRERKRKKEKENVSFDDTTHITFSLLFQLRWIFSLEYGNRDFDALNSLNPLHRAFYCVILPSIFLKSSATRLDLPKFMRNVLDKLMIFHQSISKFTLSEIYMYLTESLIILRIQMCMYLYEDIFIAECY